MKQRLLISMLVVVCVAGAGAWFVWSRNNSGPPTTAPGNREPAALPLLQGVASCTSSGCHHQSLPPRSKGTEYATWLLHDPHAQAYQVLLSTRSVQMVRDLTHDRSQRPEQYRLCLGCHAADDKSSTPAERALLADGVGCESCHGPARQWLREHHQPGWKEKDAQAKAETGFRHTKDLVVRAQTCVRCHVGEQEHDVTHDLIAAGHPPLRFEYQAFLANYPRHWPESADRANHPNFEAQVWGIGQVVSAQAALRLLGHRAATASKPWPEFAEYDCFACHHDLTEQRWRGPQKGRLGALPWMNWSLAMTAVLEKEPPRAGLRLPELQPLREKMEQLSAERSAVAPLAGKAADALQPWLAAWEKTGPDAEQVQHFLRIAERGARKEAGEANWIEGAQFFLALAALDAALADTQPRATREAHQAFLKSFAEKLAFPPLSDSPRRSK